MEKEKLLREISEVKQQLQGLTVHACEIYSRVVGYYRPVGQWNDSKKEEFSTRKLFDSAIT